MFSDSPNASRLLPDAWRRIGDPEFAPLLASVAAQGSGLQSLQRLRKQYPREIVEVALDLCAGRAKAAVKFGDAELLLCDGSGVEQATGPRVAAHKASRFRAAPRIADLCCGIGGDTMALARVGCPVLAVDHSAVRAFMTGHNASVETQVLDVAEFDGGADTWIHIDPSRRDESTGRRRRRFADYEPGPDVLEAILADAPAAAVKLGPGIDWHEVSDRRTRELEFISDAGTIVQIVLWCGALCRAPGAHTATRLSADGVGDLTFTGRPDVALPVATAAGRYLLVPDPALERSHLVTPRIASTDAAELAAGLGILTSETPLDDPWFEQHEILAELPWREQKIREWLKRNDGGTVTVRTRDGAVPTDTAQVALRGTGTTPFTLFGLRLGRRIVCLVTR
jgi:THUMP domain-like/RNA cap guanine-N2 methyltransferase